MTSKSGAMSQPEITWSQKHTDFTIVLKSGEELSVHKHVLADNSLVFEAMLSQDMEEAKNNKCTIESFEDVTVVDFLQYLYSDCLKNKDIIDLIRAALGPDKHIFKRTDFEKDKFTSELFSMANYYQVEDQMLDCTKYLKEHITDDNVMGIWMEAEKSSNHVLCEAALDHLVERPKDKTLEDVPGFSEAFASHDKPLKDLLNRFSLKITTMEDALQ